MKNVTSREKIIYSPKKQPKIRLFLYNQNLASRTMAATYGTWTHLKNAKKEN